ncbi:type II toxin-antitoxin system RelE/ParE family toxin [Ensifer sp. YR511]|uniref:type II toxin-antitoxin system RelE/ParE family toxin n=1 Tax=Ensifer sp. YR511 TaxID=1855294 RepID=UPI0008870C69|nr:type II toxin-antitoxin system RelE/ParE family toxin [Ensifer sp. YR511]SDN96807.1 hypothetical protein SAMN05216328_1451 [Ensifer sp. YR511]
MSYEVKFHTDFVPEWKELEMGLKELVGEVLDHLEEEGPFLGRPEVDTLEGSTHKNMKEIRVKYGQQVWRFAFAFDPNQKAIVLCGGEKQGISQDLFYKRLIKKADPRFNAWLEELKK